jgi:hypothetical protein
MDMAGNYYDELLNRLHQAIAAGQWQQALDSIDEELSMPYVPQAVLEQLQQMRTQVRGNLSSPPPVAFQTPGQILDGLKRQDDAALQALDVLSRSNVRGYLEVIQSYLDLPAANQRIVSALFRILHDQQVDQTMRYHRGGTTYSVIPAELDGPLDHPAFAEAWQLLDQWFSRNPSFLELCRQAAVEYALELYPQPLALDGAALAGSVARYVFRAYGDEAGWRRFAGAENLTESALVDLVICNVVRHMLQS